MIAKFQDLLGGDTIYATGEVLSLKTFYDSLKRKSIPFWFQKVTETLQVTTGTVSTGKQDQQKQMIRTENKDTQVQRNSLPWWLIITIIIVLMIIIGMFILKLKRYL